MSLSPLPLRFVHAASRLRIALSLLLASGAAPLLALHGQEITTESVVTALKRSADWQLAHVTENELTSWRIAPLYDGLWRVAVTTGDAGYLAEVIDYGNRAHWEPGNRMYHADDQAVGHAWLDVYRMDTTKDYRLDPMRERLDAVIANPITEAIEFGKTVTTPGVSRTDRWTWCDALYMAPPTLARLHAITGDAKYLSFLDQEYQYTYDMLYDEAEGFFYRDSTYLNSRTPNGKKVFWSRGNGWVYGGLALILDHLPEDYANRPFYEDLFLAMTPAVAGAQQSDGLWRPSLADPQQIPVGESSGTGFFVFGLAWGVNNGLLDRATYWPAVEAGWQGLLTRVAANGMVGYVQQPGAAPDSFSASSSREYGTGAFLLAGSEVLRGIGGAVTVNPAAFIAEAEAILNPPPPQLDGLVNLSTRLLVPAGGVGIQGFVARGEEPLEVLIRAVGPGLEALGVTNAMLDPRMTLFVGSEVVRENDSWSPVEMGDVFERTGAFELQYPSRDAAMVYSAEPGQIYTVHVTGNTAGVVLIEVFQVPPPTN